MSVALVHLQRDSAKTRMNEEVNTYLHVFPTLLPIPRVDRHIIAARQHQTQSRMHRQTPNIIRMRLKRRHLFVRVVIEDPGAESRRSRLRTSVYGR